MRRVTSALAAALLACAAVATAQDPKPAQPEQPKAGQPKAAPMTAPKMLQLEEEVEALEAHRDVKKAYVKAAEVAVEAAKARNDLLGKQAGTAPGADVMNARYDLEMAKAQLDIRTAELKEVEVRVKFAKKRLESAKAAGGGPAPGTAPKGPNPPPAAGSAPVDDAKLARWKVTIEKAQVIATRNTAEKLADQLFVVLERVEKLQSANQ